MKMIEVEYWNGKPCWAEVSVGKDEPFGIRLKVHGWTKNKGLNAASFKAHDGQEVETQVEGVSYDQASGDWVFDHYFKGREDSVQLDYTCNAKVELPDVHVKVNVDKGSVRCGKDAYGESVGQTLTNPTVKYGATVDLSALGSKPVQMELGNSNNTDAGLVMRDDTTEIFSVKHSQQKKIGGKWYWQSGSTITLNADKVMFGDKMLAVQEVTIDGTAYPVLVAVPMV